MGRAGTVLRPAMQPVTAVAAGAKQARGGSSGGGGMFSIIIISFNDFTSSSYILLV